MKPWVKYFLTGLVAFMLGVTAGGSEDLGGKAANGNVETVTETQTVTVGNEKTTAKEEPAAAPEVRSDLVCDYNIDVSGSNDGGAFIAGGTVRNDGDKTGTATVSARWMLLGSAPAQASKRIRVRPGEEREVQLKVVASIEQISAYQSGDTKCRVTAR